MCLLDQLPDLRPRFDEIFFPVHAGSIATPVSTSEAGFPSDPVETVTCDAKQQVSYSAQGQSLILVRD
jgi:hypothetical protein